jgi:hypothetical protein
MVLHVSVHTVLQCNAEQKLITKQATCMSFDGKAARISVSGVRRNAWRRVSAAWAAFVKQCLVREKETGLCFPGWMKLLEHAGFAFFCQCFVVVCCLPRTTKVKSKPCSCIMLLASLQCKVKKCPAAPCLENLDVFKDPCNIAGINSKNAKCFAEKMKKVRKEMYNLYLTDNQETRLRGSGVSSCLSTETSGVGKLKKLY